MSTGVEKVLPLGSTARLAGELEFPEQYSLWFHWTAFILLSVRTQAEVGGGERVMI